ncbi:hypothetical protein MMC10_003977 [Thelotrema lepadinum]|nr:hypothetical protein [Thelotrema lepadinum]
MSTTLPAFIYLAKSTDQPDGYTFNYIDSVNVSWYWDNAPEGSTVGLIFWSHDSNSSNTYLRSNHTSLRVSSFKISTLSFSGVSYPTLGHYELTAYSQNGTKIGDANSVGVTVTQNNGVGPQCYNCTDAASVLSSSAALDLATSIADTSLPAATITVTPVGPSQPPPPSNSDLNGGAIAGIVIGTFAAFAVGGALVWLLCLRRRSTGKGTRESLSVDASGSDRAGATPTDQNKRVVEKLSILELSGNPRVAEMVSDRRLVTAELEALR